MRLNPFPMFGALSCTTLILFLLPAIRHHHKIEPTMLVASKTIIKLPKPRFKSAISLEEALLNRRSIREYKKEVLPLVAISQLLWAAQGITDAEGKRTAPSAGALYPLEVYIACGAVESLPAGVYHYLPDPHALALIAPGDKRKLLGAAAGMQGAVHKGAAVLVIAADYKRTSVKYGEWASRYVHMEAGHASQNVYLQAVALDIGTVAMGAFSDYLVRQVLSLPANEHPLYLMPLGKY